MDLQKEIKALTQQLHEEMITTRRYLHQHPEVSYKEFENNKIHQI